MDPITVIELVIGGVGAGGVLLLVVAARRAVKKHGVPALIWRWFSGHALNGHFYTDAGWTRRGVRATHPQGRPVARWHYQPRIHRASVRTGSTGAVLAALYGFLAAPSLTIDSIVGAGALGLSVVSWRAVHGIRNWRHHKMFVEPLHAALAPRLGIPAITKPAEWLQIPQGFQKREDGTQIRFALPKDFAATAEARKVIAEVVGQKLGLEDISVKFEMIGVAPAGVITMSAPPPAKLLHDQLLPLMEKARDTAPVLGMGRSGAVIDADLEAESPHILISAGPGAGKSELTGTILTQQLHRGAVGLILDVKRTSHQWAKGLPSIKYCRDIVEIHEALCSLPPELTRRAELVDNLSDINGNLPPEVNIGPRFWVVCEEMNTTVLRLQAYWRTIKEKGDPNMSPAIDALNECLFMGRAMKMHVIAMGQQMNATATGGGAARECFAIRCVARYTPQAWRMLFGSMPMPRKTKHVGRWQIVTDVVKETQVGYLTNQEKRKFALSGIVTPFPDLEGMAEGMAQPIAVIENTNVYLTGDVLPSQGVPSRANLGGTVPGTSQPMTLREACGKGILTVSLESARAARKRDSEFPAPAGISDGAMTYGPDELMRWENNRERGEKGA